MNVIILPGNPPPAADPAVTIRRHPVRTAADWQQILARFWRAHRTLDPAVPGFLKDAGLLSRCTFLASGPGGPLTFRHIGAPTLAVLGRGWGRAVLHQPDDADPHAGYARLIGAEYAEAIEGGEPVFNTVTVRGIGAGFSYSHLLAGWTGGDRRAVLSAVVLH
ncbi:hypothetical protein M2352_000335 [Azospirillum fermentarium]|uniref:hypothetical protein n=1 Tax=Azospirillum fermentarium TaxID=1233114 RepID=UPI0022278163|nr:hypothetical protein [Azospirillum fermentarium]MCW2244744.1 hypothetical protein [Azospirillum fermentarium]